MMRGSRVFMPLKIIQAASILFAVLFSGCGVKHAWWEVGGYYGRDSYEVDLPKGWMLSGTSPFMLITRDGLLVQGISVTRSHVDARFANTRKKFRQDMLPQEAAEVFVDNLASDPDITNFEVLENRPTTVGGQAAFRVLFAYRNKDRLKYKILSYGLIREKTFYAIIYYAPARHYFERDLGVFEKIVKSFRLTGRETEAPIREPAGRQDPETQL